MNSVAPQLVRIPVRADKSSSVVVIVHDGNAYCPEEGLKVVGRFAADGSGGWIGPAQVDSGLWGYLNERGAWLIAPTLDNARGFSDDGFARFCEGGLWGYLSLDAQKVITPQFEDARAMEKGVAGVQTGKNVWRVIDSSGQFTCDAEFSNIEPFGAAGLAAASVRLGRGRAQFGYIDREGQWKIELPSKKILNFGEFEVAPATRDQKLFGLINTAGEWVLEPTYPNIEEFNSDGLAYFDEEKAWENGHGYLDLRGSVVVRGGRHLSRNMVCGVVADSYKGTAFLRRDGTPLETPLLRSSSGFDREGCFAVALDRVGGKRNSRSQWGVLRTDGSFIAAPEEVLEPLTNANDWFSPNGADTPVSPFITRDQQLVWLDASGAIVWRAEYSGGAVILKRADGETLWSSGAKDYEPPEPYFTKPAESYFRNIESLDDVVPLAESLLVEAERSLHALATGEKSADDEGDEDRDEDVEIDEDDEDSEDDFGDHWHDCGEPHSTTVYRKRIMRMYIDEDHNGYFEFLSDDLGDLCKATRLVMQQKLSEQFGPLIKNASHLAPFASMSGEDEGSWLVQMKQPLPDDDGALPESREMWLTLISLADSGDGDVWHELWLQAAPGVETWKAAQAVSTSRLESAEDIDVDVDADETDGFPLGRPTPPDDDDDLPTTREEWMEAVGSDGDDLERVPNEWLDEEMVTAALANDVGALAHVPVHLQTQALLESLVRRGADTARDIPVQCMTEQALELARSLYADDADWEWHDEHHSELPAELDYSAFSGTWGALFTVDMVIKALGEGATLNDVPPRLRTAEMERFALEINIDNIHYVAKDQITSELAMRAARSGWIQQIPEHLLTPEMCELSARNSGQSLPDIPEKMRSVDVCVNALTDFARIFAYVPETLRLQVATRMIEMDLASGTKQGKPTDGSAWHCNRAWTHLWTGNYLEAISDAKRSLAHVYYPRHPHYVLACAYRALGQDSHVTAEAATVLSYVDAYRPEWNESEDTGWLKKWVANAYKSMTDEDFLAQLKTHPLTLSGIPAKRINEDMVDAALASNGKAIKYVPERFISTPERYAIAVDFGQKSLDEVPSDMMSEAACLAFVHDQGRFLRYVPVAFRTLDVCLAAVRDDATAIDSVPEALRSEVEAIIATKD